MNYDVINKVMTSKHNFRIKFTCHHPCAKFQFSKFTDK